MRAGDADRDGVMSVLSDAYADGRLTHEEFETRLEQAQRAKTYGELSRLTADIPVPRSSAAEATSHGAASVPEDTQNLRKGWLAWAGVSGLVNVIWLASWIAAGTGPTYYWPIWVMGPWGVAMLIGTLSKRQG